MTNKITLDQLEKYLTFFRKMYDYVRIVDPVKKRVLEQRGNGIKETDEVCYNYWKNEKICDNCISIRACHENKSFIKLEQNPDSIIVVTALPVETAEKPTVLELLKNATDSMMIGSGDYNKGHMMHNVISEMNDMVVKDQLTALYNRHFINDRLPVDIVQATIYDQPLSIIFMDVDNLKNINDAYGHSVGDLALKEVGKNIKNCIRIDNDWVARYGGDEFIVCLKNTTSDKAYHIAERILNSINGILIQIQSESIHLTASIGIHTMQDVKLTTEEIINYADIRMYEAKKLGKNRISRSVDMRIID